MIGESILLHVALRCSKLRSVDASWSNVGDNGIEALVQNVHRLGSAVAITKKKVPSNFRVLVERITGRNETVIFLSFQVGVSVFERLSSYH